MKYIYSWNSLKYSNYHKYYYFIVWNVINAVKKQYFNWYQGLILCKTKMLQLIVVLQQNLQCIVLLQSQSFSDSIVKLIYVISPSFEYLSKPIVSNIDPNAIYSGQLRTCNCNMYMAVDLM